MVFPQYLPTKLCDILPTRLESLESARLKRNDTMEQLISHDSSDNRVVSLLNRMLFTCRVRNVVLLLCDEWENTHYWGTYRSRSEDQIYRFLKEEKTALLLQPKGYLPKNTAEVLLGSSIEYTKMVGTDIHPGGWGRIGNPGFNSSVSSVETHSWDTQIQTCMS
jgi:hypothetical protein